MKFPAPGLHDSPGAVFGELDLLELRQKWGWFWTLSPKSVDAKQPVVHILVPQIRPWCGRARVLKAHKRRTRYLEITDIETDIRSQAPAPECILPSPRAQAFQGSAPDRYRQETDLAPTATPKEHGRASFRRLQQIINRGLF